ncbi:hypothetical protein HETIRDRAFT_413884 [Heterobasidion irregulare TC 32-1]|uniref:Uncharacterized protein n=1 Tax=Heterobasidion irregulare (strain TC 32-1) TaxID=747525 RepID=W4KR23_HETIT|nr:uncharacterized protein HETIRDRAFT_413884 [Heterobasidion irregulare TC 32-1]ETW87840.1 hypothetical protein HETIRDRAFT_413884 [Heterobasidion irregulare TC 32-1]
MNRGDCEGAAMSTSALATCPGDFGRAGTIWINACGGSALQRSARWCAVEYNLVVFGLGGQMGTALGWDGMGCGVRMLDPGEEWRKSTEVASSTA